MVAFDKTGTLTVGRPAVTRVERFDPRTSEADLLRLAAAAERRSSHPLAKAVVERAEKDGIDVPEPTSFEVIRGRGVRAEIEGRAVLAGNAAFLSENAVVVPSRADAEDQTVVYIASGGQALGVLHLVAMVGDGINDAPALAAADVGIAMGVAGTQAAIEAADVALMADDIGKIADARAIARRAYRTIQQNLFVGVGVVHVLGITAALFKAFHQTEASCGHESLTFTMWIVTTGLAAAAAR